MCLASEPRATRPLSFRFVLGQRLEVQPLAEDVLDGSVAEAAVAERPGSSLAGPLAGKGLQVSDNGLDAAELQQHVIGLEYLRGQLHDFRAQSAGPFEPVGAASVSKIAAVLGQMLFDSLAHPACDPAVRVNELIVVPERYGV